MKIAEIFESLQGEGPLMGRPMLFIRLSGCNLSCEWCDTKYAQDVGRDMKVDEVADAIEKCEFEYVCWTGGEPLLQADEIMSVVKRTAHKRHCLETNGTLNIPHGSFYAVIASPKDLCKQPPSNADYFKFVTRPDGFDDVVRYVNTHSMERDRIFIQPLSAEGEDIMEANRSLWVLCVREGFSLSPRLHIMMFGNKRGI
ncbi:MAG TPA: 7-carboxy-7-deazaguanine synthase QueE [Candidatus Methanofastidiosa archaeon]|nr:7-carboxy-7-deazaguanine synthase QueE [Candidatus Methanofastidiosa archaeon]